MPEISSLELFVEVARCRSVSRAAERAGVSQSAVSQRISHLEKALGVRLLDRSSRPLSLTAAGEVLLDGGGPIASAYRALSERVAAMGRSEQPHETETAGPLRVSGIYSTGIDWLGQVARQWSQAQGPDQAWELDFASHDAVRDALLTDRADLGVVSYPEGLADGWGQPADEANGEPAGRWAWVPLRDEPLALVCPPNHRLTREPVVAARHLRTQTLLMLDVRLPLGAAIAAYLKQHGAFAPEVSRPHDAGFGPAGASTASGGGGFDNLDTLKSAIVATETPAILPTRFVAEELATHRLAAVPLRPPIARPLAVAYRLPTHAVSDEPPTHLADAVAFLKQHANAPAEAAAARITPVPFPATAATLNAATA
ncbi:MAG: LysR family transcriptional regulator [Planctomycetota bacterium]